ncbi:unnamed protein product [Bursaphelenchus xylophilus]|uniref:(pine wood nematode) hypothetical protein n=1 Tax=Bursaphelenchus xylophilus TaxID=6326 RepID=A0A1I7S653_BURXY|nr:unnamed protein product [Bursaphelenchus xylophilus]CAG9082239.1 unnamed protein product [Bursaphelenchus xylophilus]
MVQKYLFLPPSGSKQSLEAWDLGYGPGEHLITHTVIVSIITFVGSLLITLVYLGQCDRRILSSERLRKIFKLMDEKEIEKHLEGDWVESLATIDTEDPSAAGRMPGTPLDGNRSPAVITPSLMAQNPALSPTSPGTPNSPLPPGIREMAVSPSPNMANPPPPPDQFQNNQFAPNSPGNFAPGVNAAGGEGTLLASINRP